ncbi:hypothetical protein UCMB321_2621 [Pseudomonas batumici]|uniref:Uncharacterized protein n=1 Tax=Pseudomonas batumici TaxID=226910 RepID=A0A0C2IFP6_9PSED|nr:hypothetical protein UCMB321_2621 [Pseudomonas batumici]
MSMIRSVAITFRTLFVRVMDDAPFSLLGPLLLRRMLLVLRFLLRLRLLLRLMR